MLLGLIFHQINKETEESIRSKNRKIEKLSEETDKYYTKAAENLNTKIRQLDEQKSQSQSEIVKPYCDVFCLINNITFEKFKASDIQKADYNSFEIVKLVSGYDGSRKGIISDYVAGSIITGGVSLLLSNALPIGLATGAVSEIIRGSKLTDQENEVKKVLAQQKLICEEAKLRADILNDTASKCDEIVEIIRILNVLVSRATQTIRDTLNQYGNNYDNWPDSEQYLLMTSVNMVAGLNKIITTQVLNEDGSINKTFVKVVGAAGNLPEGKPMDMESLQEEPEEYLYFCYKCLNDGLTWVDTDSKFFVFSSKYGNKKTNISPGVKPDLLPTSWRCPCCGTKKDKLLRIPLCPASKEEIKNGISCMRTEEDFFKWIASMMVMTEEEIKSLNGTDRKQAVRNEIDRLNNYYDYETLKAAVKSYGYFAKNCNWDDKNDREWMYTFHLNPLKKFHRIRVEQLNRFL